MFLKQHKYQYNLFLKLKLQLRHLHLFNSPVRQALATPPEHEDENAIHHEIHRVHRRASTTTRNRFFRIQIIISWRYRFRWNPLACTGRLPCTTPTCLDFAGRTATITGEVVAIIASFWSPWSSITTAVCKGLRRVFQPVGAIAHFGTDMITHG